jgi:DNA polymerase III subunit delta'
MASGTGTSVWDNVVGHAGAVDLLRHSSQNPVHAYFFLGTEGDGKEIAARAFAATLLSGTDDLADRTNELVLRGIHPDVHEVRREGASILRGQAEDVITMATTTPVEGRRKVIIMHEVNLMQPAAIVQLLKIVEEPAEGVFFILLADQMMDLLVTFASRCFRVHFGVLNNHEIVEALVAGGINRSTAEAAAKSAHGSLDRARLVASDSQLVHRRERFANIPRRVDGTGATVLAIVEEILGLIDDAAEPLLRRHEQEAADLEANLNAMGVKRGGKKALEDRHKREVRRHRTDELRAGLAEVASVYRDELVSNPNIHHPEAYITAVERIHQCLGHLGLNVNEAIMLRNLIWSLPSVTTDAALEFLEN